MNYMCIYIYICICSRKLSGKPRHVSAKGLEKYQGFFSVRPGSHVLLFHSYLRSSQPSMLKVWLDALPKAIVLDPCLVQLTPEWLFLSTGSSPAWRSLGVTQSPNVLVVFLLLSVLGNNSLAWQRSRHPYSSTITLTLAANHTNNSL